MIYQLNFNPSPWEWKRINIWLEEIKILEDLLSSGTGDRWSRWERVIFSDRAELNAHNSEGFHYRYLTVDRKTLSYLRPKRFIRAMIAHEEGHQYNQDSDVLGCMDFEFLPKEEQLRMKREMEFAADKTGAEMLDYFKLASKHGGLNDMAAMLYFIHNGENFDDEGLDHPSLSKRIQALGEVDPRILDEYEIEVRK